MGWAQLELTDALSGETATISMTVCWPSVGHLLDDCRLFVNRLLVDSRPTEGRQIFLAAVL